VKIKQDADNNRADCATFFEQCDASGCGDFFVFLSYFPVMSGVKGKGANITQIRKFQERDNFILVEGPEAFRGCSFPFDHLKGNLVAPDVSTFRETVFSAVKMEAYFKFAS